MSTNLLICTRFQPKVTNTLNRWVLKRFLGVTCFFFSNIHVCG